MKIESIDVILLSIPFSDGSAGQGIMPGKWSELDFALIRIEADNGLVGWGEGFGYFCKEAVASIWERSIIPLLVGKEVSDPPAMLEAIQRAMVLQGRHGISTFAQSGVDIALWDLIAKSEQVSLSELLGSEKIRSEIPAYASLVRYADGDLVALYSEKALSEGYPELKLHEITMPEILRCHAATGGNTPVSVDVNCNWSESFVREAIPELKSLNTSWLEEPIFPPDDFRLLASFREAGLPIAAGENACTSMPFSEMIELGAVDLYQPSITKVGGVTEFQKISKLVRDAGKALMPHSPYFGPGYLAALQFAAVDPLFELFEYLYIEPESWIFPDMPLPEDGNIPIPDGPGLGTDPNPAVLEKYRTK